MLDALFSPYTLKGKTIKNRLTVPAMVTDYCTEDGKATERYLAYHEAKAKGGFGLIITEDYAVAPYGKGFKTVAGLWDDDQIESHSELPRRVHQYGATILAQIYHCGRQTNWGAIAHQPYAPSAIPCPFGTDIPLELTIPEIQKIVSQFGDTALRAKKCGFDGVEIHGAHGYLVAEFLSPYSNKRVDEYGGNIHNRMRFAIEIIKDIREKCGEEFIIGMRISGDEMIEGGRTLEDTKAMVPFFEAAGLDLIHVTAGVYASADAIVPSSYRKHGWIVDLAKEVKEICGIPVITVGRINDPVLANSIITSGKADFTSMGRASLVDPDLPNKAKEGRFEDIRHCIGCNFACLGILFTDNPIKCVLNPTLGNESTCAIKTADVSKKVAVIGAGPAGLEAALAAKKAGHNVTVYEQGSHAGGQFYQAAIPPSKGELASFIQWQTTQCRKNDIDIIYNTEVTVALMKEAAPDAIILATGAKLILPPIKGIDHANVCKASDVLLGKVNPGYNCVVIGGGQVGAETANYLGQQLKNVTIIEMLGGIALDEALAPRWDLLKNLEARKVACYTETTVTEITDNAVLAKKGDTKFTFAADTVIIATGSVSECSLRDDLVNAGFDVKVTGDAKKVGMVLEATSDGYEVGRYI